MDYSQYNHSYNMILGRDILYELRIDLSFSENTIMLNGGRYKGRTTPMKDVSKISFNVASNWLKEKIVQND